MNIKIIRNKVSDLFIDSVRLFCLIFIVFLSLFHDWNVTASIIFGLIALSVLFFSVKILVQIDSNKIIIFKHRLLKRISTAVEINIESIEKIEYTPEKTSWLIVLLPGSGGFKNATLKITETNGNKYEFLMTINANDLMILNEMTNSLLKANRQRD